MFDHHKKSPWFAEKYDPSTDCQTLRTRVRKEGWKGRLQGFLLDLESGKFDPDLNDTPSSPVVKANEQQQLNGESSSGTDGSANGTSVTAAAATGDSEAKQGGDDDMQFNMDLEEPVDEGPRPEANGKAPSTGYKKQTQENRGEEISVDCEGNQVMIRTIPPDIGRVKLEEVSFITIHTSCWLSCSNRLGHSCVQRFRVSFIWLWATRCKSATFIVLGGSGSKMTPICQLC
jgi:hypothetical protein